MSAGYGFVFLILAACAALVTAAAPWPVQVAGAAAAVSFLVVAVAYFGAGPRLLCKRASGRRGAWAWPVHGPYFVLVALSYRLAVCGSREGAFVQIVPNVFLGRRLTEREARRVGGWPAVLDLAGELTDPPVLRAAPHYRSLPLLDATAPTQAVLREAVGWVKDRAANGPVYVHCALGHGRSALVAAAYLLATGTVTSAKEAVAHLRGLRPGVRLNRAQRAALDRFAGGLATSAPSA
ncbi:hypothetical protein GobsT_01580 [Gemmata obscuriglobus]|uniref:Tyrosine specific protein phosphatases domain-containing protein n=1 Tax=Gemmata obscuriglobus TaxID=114 RepID=A0A2Z3HBW0_9BACT|nr:dual specificity protein phosphatase family protein [Gemmata obscuriglobus]AWM41226.1 hypothetical protein C1280_32360 [Gemmata obscuriglobus]QEG25432.1 hypothetical protein GobsT_01580 [Gemmata obscuriglobus]VTR98561.1 dual specificity protein phosphatase : Uncharacterized protein OS=Corallococcus coralloides (strain ATCC 25202 / DSM 2259 / NBRC 100086 / M2) GN=COCOR_04549 PE=4 SV=1: DSPc [Gemmata obscuriglobus UQM 2246]